MSKIVKAYLSILFMSFAFFSTIDTKYVPAIGDYILEYIGIRSWTGDSSGTHLTVLYFGILFLIGLLLVRKYAVEALEMRGRKVFIIFVVLVTSFTFVTGYTAQSLKKASDGLLVIGFNHEDSKLEYQFKDDELVEFEAVFALQNYGDRKLEFYVSIDSFWLREDGIDKIEILNSDGSATKFVLQAGESRAFTLDLEKHMIKGGYIFGSGGSKGIISEIILSNDAGERVKLTSKDFFGVNFARNE